MSTVTKTPANATVEGLPAVGELIITPHLRWQRVGRHEGWYSCSCPCRVRSVTATPGGFFEVMTFCETTPKGCVTLPICVLVTPEGRDIRATLGGTPVKRYIKAAEQPAVAA